jgi:radical SAM protein with 4Fe4S-binding SPASM domain
MPQANKSKELNTDEVKRMLDIFAEAGVLWLLLTGGEPLTRKDFKEIFSYAKQKGFIITLFTNATMIDEDMADFLADWGLFALEVTVHSMNQEIFESITKVSGSFERCMNGIRLLHERGIKLRIKTVVMQQNKDETDAVQQFAEEMGAEYRFDAMIQPQNDGCKTPIEYRLSPQQIVDLEARDEGRIKDWLRLYELGRIDRGDQVFMCGAGINSFHLDSEGLISACSLTRHEGYDLRNGTFEEAWEDVMPKTIFRKTSTDSKCKTCDLVSICGRCPGWSYLETGDEEAKIDFHCQVGRLKSRVMKDYQPQSS